jgi:signal peptidase I
VRRAVAVAGLAVAALVALSLLGLVGLLATGTLKPYAIPGSAMEPTLHCARPAPGCQADRRDRVLALTRLVSYGRGDVVVFDPPPLAERECPAGTRLVKRIVGLPGERVELRPVDGVERVYVDGARLAEPYVEQHQRTPAPIKTFMLSAGDYFVLGDNRAQSCDSRLWGPLPGGKLAGKLVATYWPFDRIAIR